MDIPGLTILQQLENLGDWNPLDDKPPTQEAAEQAAQGQYELDAAYARCFSTPDGQRVLQHLYSTTILQPTFNPSMPMLNGVFNGFAREGQNALVSQIVGRIRRAADGPPGVAKDKAPKTKKTAAAEVTR